MLGLKSAVGFDTNTGQTKYWMKVPLAVLTLMVASFTFAMQLWNNNILVWHMVFHCVYHLLKAHDTVWVWFLTNKGLV